MAEMVRLDEVVTNIMHGMTAIVNEQESLNEIKALLYMNLSRFCMYEEETALSTHLDHNEEWVRHYIANMIVRGCTERSVEAYRQEYKMFFSMVNKSIPQIGTADIRGYLAHCKLVRKNSDTTINNRISMLRNLFAWLTEEEYIEKNPMLRIKENKTERKVKEVFTDEQVTVIRDAALKKNARDIAIVDFLYRSGVRISELVALNRDDIDFVDRQCIVYGKGRKERPVYLNGEAVVHLKEYLDTRTDDSPALFVSLRKPYKRLTDDGVRYMLRSLGKEDERINMIRKNPHKWRRQFVTEMLEKDVPITLVADLVGHASIGTTKANYANYSKSKAREAHRKYVG